MRLSDLKVGQKAYVSHVDGEAKFVKRLIEMGFVTGEAITVSSKAPLSDPKEYIVKGTSVTLRESEARLIKVTTDHKSGDCCGNCADCANCALESLRLKISRHKTGNGQTCDRRLRVALLGNPNCGKTTLFNRISGGHEHEANYAGCTVDSHMGSFEWDGVCIELVDLPGTYSLTTFSPEERYVDDWLKENKPDLILNVIDATNLQRNLYLTTQLYDKKIPIIGALNMFDQLEKSHNTLDVAELSKRLGFPCYPVVSRTGKGLHELFDNIIEYDTKKYDYPVIKYNEDATVDEKAQARFHFINHALEGIYRVQTEKERWVSKIDRVVTHKFWGYPIFLLVLYAMFQLTFTLGDYPMQWIEAAVEWLGATLASFMAEGWLKDLLIDGILGGLGSVIVFLPNILILYFCISILEDTGYMARAAYIMDRPMRAIGLHGRSFIPMIMGFGCNVPAIMASRSIENRRARLLTMLVTPFMSCSARLPVYLLFAGTFFPHSAGLVLTGIYVAGIVAAIFSAKLFDIVLPQYNNTPYIMELPAYREPFLRSAVRRMWDKGVQYLHKMGTVILFASILVWCLGYFPHNEELSAAEQQEQSYLGQIGKAISPVFDPMGANWKMDVGIVAGLSAKEVVVSTLGVLYNANEDEGDDSLSAILTSEITAPAALAYLIFILLYMPCIATVTAIGREAGHWKWAIYSALYSTVLAWLASVAVYQTMSYFY